MRDSETITVPFYMERKGFSISRIILRGEGYENQSRT